MTEFSEKLQSLRENKGWSKTKLAQKIGVSLSTYANWEYGIAEPDIETIKNICNALDISADVLLNVSSKSTKVVDLDKDPVVLSYDGRPVSKEDMEVIKAILERHKNNG